VISHAVASAPFSQNSNGSGSAGFDHAQLTHWTPSALFWRDRIIGPLAGTPSCERIFPSDRVEPQPPAGSV